jgi:hypothetical protein
MSVRTARSLSIAMQSPQARADYDPPTHNSSATHDPNCRCWACIEKKTRGKKQ